MANRLSACGRFNVLLLEAGGSDQRLWLKVPLGYGMSFYNPSVNWMYQTEPDPHLNHRSAYWPRGKVLGGSSAINAMVFIRGQARDFDDWARLGNSGWSYQDVLPYFKKLEDSPHGPSRSRGADGPLHVSDVSKQVHPLCEHFLKAGEELGIQRNADINGDSQEGVCINQITTRNGFRESASTAYLKPALSRSNLKIITLAHVSRVLFENRKAVGIEYLQDGIKLSVRASREVILSAGSINTPQILQLSGVGPGQVLQKFNIPLVLESPAVGQNLQDHLCIDYIYRAKVPTLNKQLGSVWGQVWSGLQYITQRQGPLSLSINQGGGFCKSTEQSEHPDLQLYFSPLSYLKATPGIRKLTAPDAFPGFLLSAQPCRPESCGSITVQSSDPQEAPKIWPNSLSTPADKAAMLLAAQWLRKLAATPSLGSIIDHEILPGPQVQSIDQMMADIYERASTVYHPVSTCRMGTHIEHAVVDSQLRAHGLLSLRIVDASVFPTLTSGNTNAPTLMLAEKAADMVLADHQY
jgi:choline dehydrogenase